MRGKYDKIIYQLLLSNEQYRDDDVKLYLAVVEIMWYKYKDIETILRNVNYRTVVRVRRDLQVKHIELLSSKEIEKIRAVEEQECRKKFSPDYFERLKRYSERCDENT